MFMFVRIVNIVGRWIVLITIKLKKVPDFDSYNIAEIDGIKIDLSNVNVDLREYIEEGDLFSAIFLNENKSIVAIYTAVAGKVESDYINVDSRLCRRII